MKMEIIEKAPAKINLGLDVLEKRTDGYHELEMVMSSVDLADRLIMEEIAEDKIIIETNKAFLPIDKRNNVYQAASILKKRYGIKKGIRIRITKNIPVAAGLGGGSTDCAAALRGMVRLWDLDLSMAELIDIGMEVGTDVPYCLYGTTSHIAGKGELVTPLRPMPQCWVILVKPRLSVSTGKIFQEVELDQLHHPDIAALSAAVLAEDYPAMIAAMGNSLEAIYNALKGFCDEVYLVRTLK